MKNPKLSIQQIKPGQCFRIDPSYEDEWFLRGKWMKLDGDSTLLGRNDVAVNLEQGVHNIGELHVFADRHPLILVNHGK